MQGQSVLSMHVKTQDWLIFHSAPSGWAAISAHGPYPHLLCCVCVLPFFVWGLQQSLSSLAHTHTHTIAQTQTKHKDADYQRKPEPPTTMEFAGVKSSLESVGEMIR